MNKNKCQKGKNKSSPLMPVSASTVSHVFDRSHYQIRCRCHLQAQSDFDGHWEPCLNAIR
jgi:hypothetical protein